jgi:hypothetical protein
MTEEIKKVMARFIKSPLYSVLPATSTWGIFTTDGNLLCNFVIEHTEIPTEIEYEVDSSGILDEKTRFFKNKPSDVEKLLQVGIVMSPQTALEIGQWLIDFVREHQNNVQIDDTGNKTEDDQQKLEEYRQNEWKKQPTYTVKYSEQ